MDIVAGVKPTVRSHRQTRDVDTHYCSVKPPQPVIRSCGQRKSERGENGGRWRDGLSLSVRDVGESRDGLG